MAEMDEVYLSALAAVKRCDVDALKDVLGGLSRESLKDMLLRPSPESQLCNREPTYFEGDCLLLVALYARHGAEDGEGKREGEQPEDEEAASDRANRVVLIDLLLGMGAAIPGTFCERRLAADGLQVKVKILKRVVKVGATRLVYSAFDAGYDFTSRTVSSTFPGSSILHDAVWAKDCEMVAALLNVGCDYTALDSLNAYIPQTPVHAAASMFDIPLLRTFFDFEERLIKGNNCILAINKYKHQSVGASDLKDARGVSVLGRAVYWALDPQLHYNENRSKAITCITFLLEQRCPFPKGLTHSFDFKLAEASLQLVELFLAYGCDPLAIIGPAPLAMLATGVLETLLDYGLEVCGTADSAAQGLTRLHIAVANGEERIVRLLLDNGAGPDLFSKDCNGKRPIDLVRLPRQVAIKALLDDAMIVNAQY